MLLLMLFVLFFACYSPILKKALVNEFKRHSIKVLNYKNSLSVIKLKTKIVKMKLIAHLFVDLVR